MRYVNNVCSKVLSKAIVQLQALRQLRNLSLNHSHVQIHAVARIARVRSDTNTLSLLKPRI